MTARKKPWPFLAGGLLVVVGLPLIGAWVRHSGEPGCALDGAVVVPDYRVEVEDADGNRHVFCCVRCVQIWLADQASPPRSITVTDEESGESVEASRAWYVRNWVVTTPATGNRIHVFRRRAKAESYSAEKQGIVLPRSEFPFR
jgi:hypothetical protein